LKIVFGHNSAVDYPISVAKHFFTEFQQRDMYTCFPQQRICCIGNRQISTSHKIDTPELINKKSAQLITSTRGSTIQNLLQIRPLRAYGQMGDETKIIFIYIFFFSGSRTFQTRGWIFLRATAQKM